MFKSSIGGLLLAIYLILVGISAFVTAVAIPPVILSGLALAAGIFLIIGR